MNNITIRQNITIHPDMAACLQYTLFSIPTEDSRESYGVMVRNEITGETATIADITQRMDISELLFDKLLTGCVTPVTLKDVVEDFIAEI